VVVVVESEYVFYPLQQLEGRIARPKQKRESVDIIYMVTHHPEKTSVDEAMLQMALRRNNANVELVSGNVTQRTNEQLVEMAESQKMREMELMQTLLAKAKPVVMDYNAEFIARETEIEKAERKKAIIVVNDKLREHIEKQEPAPVAASADAAAETRAEPTKAEVEQIAAAASSKAQFLIDGDNLLLPLDVQQTQVIQPPKVRSRFNALKRAVQALHAENLTLF
jgi:uncharacterized protein (DUF1330 family)